MKPKPMRVLALAIQKGGQGKSMSTCSLAFGLHARGYRVAVLDGDTQGNASYTLAKYDSGYSASRMFAGAPDELRKWFKGRPDDGMAVISADASLANLDKMEVGAAAANLRANLAALGEQGFDVCLIDTPPALGVAMVAALLASQYLLSPVELEQYSLQGMQKMVATVANVRKANPSLRFLGMVPNRVDGRKPRHQRHLEELRAAYPQLVVPVSIGLRDSIAEALGAQIPVWEIKKSAAREAIKEVNALTDFVVEKMELAK